MPFPLLHQMFVLHVPAHECVHPQEITAETLGINATVWAGIFLPMGYQGPSQCSYYNFSSENLKYIQENWRALAADTDATQELETGAEVSKCSQWEYDQSEFWDTAVTDNDWVCDKANYIPDLFTLAVVGLILGTFIFSAVADFFGRKMSFYVGTAAVIVFTLCMVPTDFNIHLFSFFKVAAAFGMLPLFQSPMNILCEISDISKRGFVICVACVAWSLGQIVFPLVGYLIASWKIIKVVSVAPLALFFFTWRMLPESPRWLVSKGRTKEATEILGRIAETNGVKTPADLQLKVEKLSLDTKEDSMGYLSLFAKPTLSLRTVFCTIGFTASAFIYYQIVINVSNMGGNTFLNLFLLGLVEGPGNLMGMLLSEKIGRRWTHSGLLGINTLILCIRVKMNISATFVVAYIQAMEIFPTCVRQSGIGFCSFISQMISIGGPYTIALGAHDLRYPYLALFLICLTGSIATSFLPETVGSKLPETLEDANNFGKTDKYFSFKPPRTNKYQQP